MYICEIHSNKNLKHRLPQVNYMKLKLIHTSLFKLITKIILDIHQRDFETQFPDYEGYKTIFRYRYDR